MRHRTFFACLAVIACFSPGSLSAAPILNVVAGELTGAKNVDVGGVLYDVTFLDGSCVAVFDGCNDPADFTFSLIADAVAASSALRDQVFLDTPSGAFDTEPWRINGCSSVDRCIAYIPYLIPFSGVVTVVGSVNNFNFDGDQTTSLVVTDDTSSNAANSQIVWAKFTPATAPEPSTVLLIGIGIASLTASKRRKKATS